MFPKRRSKFNATRTERGGKSFASGLEANLYSHLLLLKSAGEISDIRTQPNIFLTLARIRMIPDFVVHDMAARGDVYYEAKGFESERYLVCKKLWRHYGPAPLRIFKKSRRGVFLDEEIIPIDAKSLGGIGL